MTLADAKLTKGEASAITADLADEEPFADVIQLEARTSATTARAGLSAPRRRRIGSMTAIQDQYPDEFAHCYGCGRLNAHGLHVRTEWTGAEGLARFLPREEHVAIPGFVYGGLLASLIDCHAIGTAAAAFMQAAGQRPGIDPAPRFVTAVLEARFLKPTPMGKELLLRATATEVADRKVSVEVALLCGDIETVHGHVMAVSIPSSMVRASQNGQHRWA